MKGLNGIHACIFFSIVTALLGMQGINATPHEVAVEGKSRVVHCHFPHDFSLGGLYIVPRGESGGRGPSMRQAQGTALGEKSIKLEPGQTILLTLDRQLFLHPEKLDGTDLSGIDRLRIQFDSLDAGTYSASDLMIKHLPKLDHVTSVDMSQADVTDVGLGLLKKIKSLKLISTYASNVHGESLKDLNELPDLVELDINNCILKPSSFTAFKSMPALRYLDIGNTSCTDASLAEVSKCKQLKTLLVDGNPITDNGISLINSMPNLTRLNLLRTKITMVGLLQLNGMKLKNLVLPHPSYTAREVAELNKHFPSTVIRLKGNVIRKIDLFILAPLKSISD